MNETTYRPVFESFDDAAVAVEMGFDAWANGVTDEFGVSERNGKFILTTWVKNT